MYNLSTEFSLLSKCFTDFFLKADHYSWLRQFWPIGVIVLALKDARLYSNSATLVPMGDYWYSGCLIHLINIELIRISEIDAKKEILKVISSLLTQSRLSLKKIERLSGTNDSVAIFVLCSGMNKLTSGCYQNRGRENERTGEREIRGTGEREIRGTGER